MESSRDCRGVDQNLDVLLLKEGHSDLGFVGTGAIMQEKGLTGSKGWSQLMY